MNKLKWWFRIVGGFYLLLAVSNLYVMFLTDGSLVLAGSPFPVEPLTIRVATDYWSPSAFGLLGGGLLMLWASRDPGKNVNVARYVAWLELTGFGAYVVYSLTRGYDPVAYSVFGVIHIAIFVTGFMFARQTAGQTPRPATA